MLGTGVEPGVAPGKLEEADLHAQNLIKEAELRAETIRKEKE